MQRARVPWSASWRRKWCVYGSEGVGGTWEEEADYVQIEVVRQISERAKVRWQRYMVGYVYAALRAERAKGREQWGHPSRTSAPAFLYAFLPPQEKSNKGYRRTGIRSDSVPS